MTTTATHATMRPMATKPRPAYTDADKRDAVELAAEVGQGEASRLMDIPQPTISRWCAAAGVASIRAEKMRDAIEANKARWETIRQEMADGIGARAKATLEALDEKIADGNLRDVQSGATAVAILVDKAQLLTGAATSRSEHTDTRQVAASVVDELAQRRSA